MKEPLRLESLRHDRAAREIARPLVELFRWGLKLLPALVVLAALVYLASGVTVVKQDEVALVLRFGRLVGDTPALALRQPGLLLAWPRPIDEVVRVNVQKVHEVRLVDLTPLLGEDLPTLPGQDDSELVPGLESPRESIDPRRVGYALTGDHNIVHAQIVARFQIDDPVAYALRIDAPEELLRRAVLASALHSAGEMSINDVLASGRRELVRRIEMRTQASLDQIGSGLRLVSVELEELAPPLNLLGEFRAVQSAYIESLTEVKRAQQYRESEIPAAQADALRQITEAEGYKAARIAEAQGAAASFERLLVEYRKGPEMLRERLYRETMERTLGKTRNRVLVPPPPAGGRYTDLRITVRPYH